MNRPISFTREFQFKISDFQIKGKTDKNHGMNLTYKLISLPSLQNRVHCRHCILPKQDQWPFSTFNHSFLPIFIIFIWETYQSWPLCFAIGDVYSISVNFGILSQKSLFEKKKIYEGLNDISYDFLS